MGVALACGKFAVIETAHADMPRRMQADLDTGVDTACLSSAGITTFVFSSSQAMGKEQFARDDSICKLTLACVSP